MANLKVAHNGGKETSQKYSLDPHSWNYGVDELEHAQTHEELCNTIQQYGEFDT